MVAMLELGQGTPDTDSGADGDEDPEDDGATIKIMIDFINSLNKLPDLQRSQIKTPNQNEMTILEPVILSVAELENWIRANNG